MRTILPLTLLIINPFVGWAQCQIQGFQISADCANDAPEASMILTGGVPPYQLTFTGSNGISVFDQSGQDGLFITWMGDYWLTMLLSPVQLNVTDANGCTTSASASYQEHLLALPDVWFERGCSSTMSHLFWSGTYTYPVPGTLATGQPDPCAGSSYEYEIVNSQTWTTVASGDVVDDWSLMPNGLWQFNMPMPHGFYYVSIHPTFIPIGCQNGPFMYCYREKGAVTDPTPDGCGQRFRMKVFLGGPMAQGTTSMTDGLRVNGLLPLSEPYTGLGYTYVGSPPVQSITPAALSVTGSNALVDWIVVELRSATPPHSVLYSMPALVQRDGDVIVNSTLLETPLEPGFYRVAVRHRNHLGLMTASAYWLDLSPLVLGDYANIDLGSPLTPTFGTDARRPNGNYSCLWPGDATMDGVVKYAGTNNDRDAILQAIGGATPTNVVSNVYDARDVNLDGSIKYTGANNDRDVILQTIGGTTPTSTQVEQLP